MHITVTGGTGFIGRMLAGNLVTNGHSVHLLGRTQKTGFDPTVRFSAWNALAEDPPLEALKEADAIVHLAGESLSQRWTLKAKQKIRASRVEGTRRLIDALSRQAKRPSVLISASAIGIYGSRGDEVLTESSPIGSGFLAEVCTEWEQMADMAQTLGIRVVKLRMGIVLGAGGGALARMLPAFKLAGGGQLGPGNQWMSWIHLEDLVELVRFAIMVPALNGPVNATAPHPVTNAGFTRSLAGVLGRPSFLTVPVFALKIAFGEMSQVLLSSQRVLPRAALSAGFSFNHPELAPALRHLLVGAVQ